MNSLKVKIKRVNGAEDINLPVYKTVGSAGLDLCANVEEEIVLKPGEFKLIPTGIKIEIPVGTECQIRPRSGLAFEYGITVLNSPGTVDSDYRGEISVLLVNLSNKEFKINKNDRIAQMVFAKYERAEFELVNDLTDTERGEGGFGSTGVQ